MEAAESLDALYRRMRNVDDNRGEFIKHTFNLVILVIYN